MHSRSMCHGDPEMTLLMKAFLFHLINIFGGPAPVLVHRPRRCIWKAEAQTRASLITRYCFDSDLRPC